MFKKDNTSWVELNKTALLHNLVQIKKLVGAKALAFVVKGDAYGHGLDEILELTKRHPAIDWYCTATLTEALHLRSVGITKPILVLYQLDQDPLLAVKHTIDFVCYDLQQLKELKQAAKMCSTSIGVHIKVDTGLSRFGFLPDEAVGLIRELALEPHVAVRGIMTHFALSEDADQSYTLWQMTQFNEVANTLEREEMLPPYVHMHASSSTIMHGMQSTNLARIGAAAYGLWPSALIKDLAEKKGVSLYPVASWKTCIRYVRTLKKGSLVGYGCTYKADRDMRIAVLPVGYWHGYHRRYSNNASVLVEGEYASIVGRVAMNVVSIDVTDIPAAVLGSEVTLMGDHPHINAYELSQRIESYNPREVITRLTAHTPKKVVESPLANDTKSAILKESENPTVMQS